MKCVLAEKMLSDYSRGKLDREHMCVLRSHIKKCPDCAAKLLIMSRRKRILKISAISLVVIALVFLIVQSTQKSEITLGKVNQKVVSNIVIEIFSDSVSLDTHNVRRLAERLGVNMIEDKPVSIKMTRKEAPVFVRELDTILVLPKGINDRIDEFVRPLKDNDEVIIQIRFGEKKNEA